MAVVRRISPEDEGEISLRLESVSPERAEELLGHNTGNRRKKPRSVSQYAHDMKTGKWKDGAGEPIHIAIPGGTLGNGQNRLFAIIESGVTVRLPFLYAPLDHRLVADQGAKRTFGDVLMIEYGEPAANQLGAMVRMVRDYRLNGEFGRKAGGPKMNPPSVADLIETYLSEPNLRESLPTAYREGDRRAVRTGVIPSVAATCHYLFNEVDPGEADDFFEKLQRGVNLDEGSPILAARRWFATPDRSGSQRIQAAILIKTFNYWRQGREVERISWKGGGSKPEPFPAINSPV